MNKSTLHLLLVVTVLLLSRRVSVAQEQTNSVTGLDPQSFNILSERNIFNPNRRSRSSRTTTRASKVDSFALRGTVASYDGHDVAFFDGSSYEFRKAAKISDSIGGYKVSEIGYNFVKLVGPSNQVVNLPVQAQMQRRDGGSWAMAGRAEPSVTSTPTSPDSTSASSAPSGGGGADDVIKRLMAKRLLESKEK